MKIATGQVDEKHLPNPLFGWLGPIVQLANGLKYSPEDLEQLVKINVDAQCSHLGKTAEGILQREAEHDGEKRKVSIHGWVYQLDTGLLSNSNFGIREVGPATHKVPVISD